MQQFKLNVWRCRVWGQQDLRIISTINEEKIVWRWKVIENTSEPSFCKSQLYKAYLRLSFPNNKKIWIGGRGRREFSRGTHRMRMIVMCQDVEIWNHHMDIDLGLKSGPSASWDRHKRHISYLKDDPVERDRETLGISNPGKLRERLASIHFVYFKKGG